MQSEKLKVRLLKGGPPNSTVIILGASGCGKTTLAANLIAAEERFLIIDAKKDYEASFFSDCITIGSLAELGQSLNSGKKRIIFSVPVNDSDEALNQALNMVYKWQIVNFQVAGSITIALDELNRFAESGSWPDGLARIIQQGRSVGIKKIFGAQWFGQIPTWVRDSFSEIYTFRHTDRSGLNRLEEYGFNMDDVRDLPAYTCLHSGKNGVKRVSLVPENTKP